MKKYLLGWVLFSTGVIAQTVEVQTVDIIYGDQIIRGRHQVVLSSPEEVTVIPVEQTAGPIIAPNVVVSASGQQLSYLEESRLAENEQAIYDEVNRRTEENPFTVLFTGRIPDEIQEKRVRMMSDVGVFADHLNEDKAKAEEPVQTSAVDPGDFSEIAPATEVRQPETEQADQLSEEERLERLIGG
ncbi:hypothetical protein ACUM5Y_05950 [Marinomonas dokdonensis]|uniref:hypothetical protein n=1 Tax=Marinomonas dokdonensis TaxID=328224 RepID=UPI004055777B